ncbi:BgTH12-05542 [Blumeria graminis f. sp. triticale]|uniref:Bgt-3835 n=3 Tax=Blumeria graminis TaxID=34373 RepID=A0A381L4D1_BLUGR|nr:hypothetical protein BGT96224_3835 [Blumeria graminis f. sp. tritici 96224]CAD6503797.1 BgTH12-05542 [Blumeria graminis f. sp. triticale]VDB90419.1 Bgt-3835 [Blumeria graminis f. sp. tritici]
MYMLWMMWECSATAGHRLLHWGNHPVKWVRLTGIIVAVAERGNGTRAMRVYTLDDSSGACIDCPASTSHGNSGARSKDIGSGGDKAMPSVLTPSVPWDLVVVGSVVKVKGRIGFWWEQRQVEVVKIEILGCTDTEVRCWNEVRDFRRNILSQPWHLSHEEKRLCRKLMERQKRRARKAQRRVVEWPAANNFLPMARMGRGDVAGRGRMEVLED